MHRTRNRVAAAILLGASSFGLSSGSALSAQTPVINELVARNAFGLKDQNGDFSDWFEIRNTGSSSMNLSGYYVYSIGTDGKMAFVSESVRSVLGYSVKEFAEGHEEFLT